MALRVSLWMHNPGSPQNNLDSYGNPYSQGGFNEKIVPFKSWFIQTRDPGAYLRGVVVPRQTIPRTFRREPEPCSLLVRVLGVVY